ncbi:hypothetical protein R80B4_00136 [Fibrobacteres bacterium R8-0-B4]
MREEYDFSNARPNPYVKDLRKYEDDGSHTTEYENIMRSLKEAVEYRQGTLEVRET